MNTQELYQQHVLKNYAAPPLTIVRGEGAWVWDDADKKYLDFTTGVAVNALGHCHAGWVADITRQMSTLAHCSNLYAHPLQGQLAAKITELAGPGNVFFCNSGAEATETLLKLSRLHGHSGRYEVITAKNSFHGRTFGGMSATGQDKTQNGYHPLLPGFRYAEFNNIQSFRDAVTDKTTAILIEPIQGEGGILPATVDFLRELRELCDKEGLLLLMDEIQCGVGRTGKWFAFEKAGIEVDAIALAKGLGGGFPIGAAWMNTKAAALFKPGSHGSTYGGNPMACAAALSVMNTIEKEDLLQNVQKLSAEFHQQLHGLVQQFPNIFDSFRGEGFLMGLVLKDSPAPMIEQLRENGLLTVPAAGNVLRLLPPLNVTREELQTSLDILQKTLFSTNS